MKVDETENIILKKKNENRKKFEKKIIFTRSIVASIDDVSCMPVVATVFDIRYSLDYPNYNTHKSNLYTCS